MLCLAGCRRSRLVSDPPPEREGGVEQGDVNKSGFPQQLFVLLRGKNRQTFTHGRGRFRCHGRHPRRCREGGKSGEPLRLLSILLRKAVVRDNEWRPGLQPLMNLRQRSPAFVFWKKVEGQKAGRRIERTSKGQRRYSLHGTRRETPRGRACAWPNPASQPMDQRRRSAIQAEPRQRPSTQARRRRQEPAHAHHLKCVRPAGGESSFGERESPAPAAQALPHSGRRFLVRKKMTR